MLLLTAKIKLTYSLIFSWPYLRVRYITHMWKEPTLESDILGWCQVAVTGAAQKQ